MPQVERNFMVNQPIGAVVDYLADFANTEAWDPGTKTCTRVGPDGKPVIGTRWRNVSEFRGREVELDYQLKRRDSDHLIFIGTNKSATSMDDLSFAANGAAGTSITYRAKIDFKGLLRLASPFVKPGFEKLADETVEQMRATLNAL